VWEESAMSLHHYMLWIVALLVVVAAIQVAFGLR
jgi:hypothetical protein